MDVNPNKPSSGDPQGNDPPIGGRFGTYDPAQRQGTSGEAFAEAMHQLGEMKEYASYYLAAKLDSWKASVRNLLLYAVLGLVALIAGAGVLVTAAVLLLAGLAGALGDLLGDKRWAGDLIVGLLVLGGTLAGTWWMMARMTRNWRKQTVAKYEDRKRQQRKNYGHDVEQRARAAEHA